MSNCQLFEIRFLVRPSPQHPHYYDYQFGVLRVWLYGHDKIGAAARASAILDQLPYELISPIPKGCVCNQPTKGNDPKIDEVLDLGLALQWEVLETGSGRSESFAKELWEKSPDDSE